LYLQLNGQGQVIATGGPDETAGAATTLKAPGGWLSGTTGFTPERLADRQAHLTRATQAAKTDAVIRQSYAGQAA
jgi:ABC-type hemin transport system ATPase subunit